MLVREKNVSSKEPDQAVSWEKTESWWAEDTQQGNPVDNSGSGDQRPAAWQLVIDHDLVAQLQRSNNLKMPHWFSQPASSLLQEFIFGIV